MVFWYWLFCLINLFLISNGIILVSCIVFFFELLKLVIFLLNIIDLLVVFFVLSNIVLVWYIVFIGLFELRNCLIKLIEFWLLIKFYSGLWLFG